MSKVNYVKRWVGQDLDDAAVRKKFIRHLKRWHNEFTTPYWKSAFIDMLVYEFTIHPCGLRVETIDESFVKLRAHAAGVQTEGICLDAAFMAPTTEFRTPDLVKMIGPYRYCKHGPAMRFEWFPRLDDPRINPKYITELTWWYDEFYDETK